MSLRDRSMRSGIYLSDDVRMLVLTITQIKLAKAAVARMA
jgi:hypothetical protein